MFCQSRNALQVDYCGSNLLAQNKQFLGRIGALNIEVFFYCFLYSLEALL